MGHEGLTLLLLHVQGRPFAVDMSQVETLRRKETVFPAPEGPPDLMGYLPLGGTSVPILDLAIRLGVQAAGARHASLLVIPPAKVTPLSFCVDRVEGPVSLSWNELALLPPLLRELQPRPIIWAAAWQGEVLVPVLDLGQIVSPEETAALLELATRLGF